MNKTKIIERLLENKYITVEEAVILLEKEVIQIPVSQPVYPPYNPYPIWYSKPYDVTYYDYDENYPPSIMRYE